MFMQDKTYRFVSNGVIVPAGIEMAHSRIRQDVDIVTASHQLPLFGAGY